MKAIHRRTIRQMACEPFYRDWIMAYINDPSIRAWHLYGQRRKQVRRSRSK